jgi:DNA modification methylase
LTIATQDGTKELLRNRIVGHAEVPVDQILYNPKNWRIHPSAQKEALEASLEKVGWVGEVMINQTTGHLVDGHERVDLAAHRNETTVPATIVELTVEEEEFVLATLDPITGMATTEKNKLKELLEGIDQNDERIARLVARVAEQNRLEWLPKDPPEPRLSQGPELARKMGVEIGQIWALGDHRLAVGDSGDPECVKQLFRGQTADQLLTDPPYGVDLASKHDYYLSLPAGSAASVGDPIANDDIKDYREFFGKFLKLVPWSDYNTAYIFMQSKRLTELIQAMEDADLKRSEDLIWVKNVAVPGRQDYWHKHELIIYGWHKHHRFFSGMRTTVIDDDQDPETMTKEQLVAYVKMVKDHFADTIRENRPSISELHPTMKPPRLVARLMQDGSPEGGIVYDPFAGSGTTLVVAESLRRSCRTIELDPGYAAISIQRWVDMTEGTPERVWPVQDAGPAKKSGRAKKVNQGNQ